MAPPNGIVVAIDAGTTGVRSFAIDESGQPRGWSYREFTQHFPEPGWVEHDAAEIWTAVQATLGELRAELDQPIAAIGITNQRETVVAWDRRTGQPLHRAIVWQDRRTAPRCDELREAGHLDLVRAQTGLVLDPVLLRHEARVAPARRASSTRAPTWRFGTVDSWLLWNLTGRRGATRPIRPTPAARCCSTSAQLEWSPDLLSLFGVPPLVSARRASVERSLRDDRRRRGRARWYPDQWHRRRPASCAVRPGLLRARHDEEHLRHRLLRAHERRLASARRRRTGCSRRWPGRSPTARLPTRSRARSSSPAPPFSGCATVSGSSSRRRRSVRWPRQCPDTGGVYLVPAFTGLGSPWWDPYARGTILGITRGTGRAHLARAVVEAMAYQTRDVVEAMEAASVTDACRAPRRRRRSSDGPVAAAAGRPAPGSRGTAHRVRRRRRSARPTSPDSPKASGGRSTTSRPTGSSTASSNPSGARGADRRYEGWLRAVERSRNWAT